MKKKGLENIGDVISDETKWRNSVVACIKTLALLLELMNEATKMDNRYYTMIRDQLDKFKKNIGA